MIDVEPRGDLAVDGAWNRDAVRRPLWEHHLRKCYLCERQLGLHEFEIDHRVPQSRARALHHCDRNLFPACRYCNGRRQDRYPARGGLLSPGIDRNVEARIEQRIERVDSCEVRARFTAVDPADLYAYNTARELQRLHDPKTGTTGTAREGAQALLDAIIDHYLAHVWPLAHRVRRARRREQPDEPAEADLRRLLARDRPFTMLIRAMLPADLADLMD